MTDVSFDTLEVYDQMRNAGFSDGQARVLAAEFLAASVSPRSDQLTKAELAELRTEVSALGDELLEALSRQMRAVIGSFVLMAALMILALNPTA